MASRSSAPPPDAALARWARFAVRHRGRVLIAWIALVIILGGIGTGLGGKFSNSFKIPGAESQKAVDLLKDRFPSQSGDSATIVVKADAGIDDPTVKQQWTDLLTKAQALPEVTTIVSPYDNQTAVSADGTIAYATVNYDLPSSEADLDNLKQFVKLVDASSTPGFQVEAGGSITAQADQVNPFGLTELIGVGAAVVILLIAFGSVIAMGLPIAAAIAGLIAGFLGISIGTYFFDMSDFTPGFAAMIGLGVGIDYSLFVVTRYREGLASGLDVENAIVRAVDTAGRAVLFAGTVVAIALLGLFSIGIPFIEALGLAAAIVVVFSVLVALVIVPVLLSYLGKRIDKWSIPGLRPDTTADHKGTFWYKWSQQIQKHPWPFLLGAVTILVLLASPILDMRLGFSDDGSQTTEHHIRRAYDLTKEGFGAGYNGPLLFVVENSNGLDQSQLQSLSETLKQVPGVAAVAQPFINDAGDTAVMQVIPTTSPQDAATPKLVNHLRDDIVPTATAGTGTNIYVGGPTAAFIDIGDKITTRMPIFFAIVIGLSVILLAAVFRSVVVPIKAALMNLLSIGATYGAVVAVFQWGWAKDLFGLGQTGPIESFLPMMLFAILFGLSMDYEVFLLSRIREDYVHTGDARESVAHGLSATARVIAAAAAVMVCVFLSFVLGDDRVTKEFGLGLATAIFVDATIVRLILVPATMELLGSWNWWFPKWLDRIVPKLNVEGSTAPTPAAAQVAVEAD